MSSARVMTAKLTLIVSMDLDSSAQSLKMKAVLVRAMRKAAMTSESVQSGRDAISNK